MNSKIYFFFLLLIFEYQSYIFAQNNAPFGELVWSFKTNGMIIGSAVANENAVFFGSTDGNIYAVTKNNGTLLWKYATSSPVTSTPTVFNDTLFVLSENGYLYSLHAQNGSFLWSFKTNGEHKIDVWDYYLSSPVVSNEKIIFGSGDSCIYAVNKQDGKLIWSYKTQNIVHAVPVVENGVVYIGSYDGYFYAINEKNGSLIWKFKTVGDRWFPSGDIQKGATLAYGSIYFGSRDFNIYALEKAHGYANWNMKELGSWVVATPIVKDSVLYVGTSDSHHFYAMDAFSGEVLWKTDVPLNVFGECLVVDGSVVFGCFDGKLYKLNKTNGIVEGVFSTKLSELNKHLIFNEENQIHADIYERFSDIEKIYETILSLGSILSTPIICNNVIYFGSADNYFYALKLEKEN